MHQQKSASFHWSRNLPLRAEYSGGRCPAQQKRENIGKMGQVPFPKEKSEPIKLRRLMPVSPTLLPHEDSL